MIDYDFRQSIGYWIGSASLAGDRAMDAALRPHGFTLRQVQVLACLALRESATQTQIAEMIGVEPPTLVRVIDRMETSGWIARHADPNDRRKNVIRATKKVAGVWERIVEIGTRAEARATRGIKKADLKVARGVLEKMLANLASEDQ